MHLISFHLDGFRCGGTEILARAATYAECLFDLGIHTPIYAALKTYSIGKTMLGAVGALNAVQIAVWIIKNKK